MKPLDKSRIWQALLLAGLMLNLTSAAWGQTRVSASSNLPPTVKLISPITSVVLPAANCGAGMQPSSSCSPANAQIKMSTEARDPESDGLTYRYSATGGSVEGSSSSAVWDLSGLRPGTYRANVYVTDAAGHEVCDWVTVNVTECGCEAAPTPAPAAPRRTCAALGISSSSEMVNSGESVTVTADVRGADAPVSYNWIVSGGSITRGQGSPSIVVDTAGLDGRNVTATVEIGGLGPECSNTRSVSISTRALPKAVKIDSFGSEPNDAVKARMDNLAISLQQDPSAQGYIVAYGSCAGEGMKRAQFMKDYLVTNRGLDASRVTIVDGGCRDAAAYELYTVPQGATAPAAENSGTCAPCRRR